MNRSTVLSVLCLAVAPVAEPATVTSSPNPSTYGQSVAVSASPSVQIPPGAIVEFLIDGAVYGASAQSGTWSPSALPAGKHTITVGYGALGHFADSGSTTQTVIANPGGSFGTPITTSAGNVPQSLALLNAGGSLFYAAACGQKIFVNLVVPLGAGATRSNLSAPQFPVSYNVNAYQIAVADVNNDGNLDLVALDNATGFRVLLGNGDGTFQTPSGLISAAAAPVKMVASDFNHDGWPDVAVVDSQHNTLNIVFNKGDGTFLSPVVYSLPGAPNALAAGDVNHDGFPDIVVTSSGADSLTVFLGSAGGQFQMQPAIPVGSNLGLADTLLADLDGDGNPDIVTANATAGSVSVLKGNGDGTFRSPAAYPVGANPNAVAYSDFNGDQKLDLVTANTGGNSVSVLFGNGDGTFPSASQFGAGPTPVTVLPAPLNISGRVDLLVANSTSGSINTLLSVGPGNCVFSLGSLGASVGPGASTGSVSLSTGPACSWTVSSNAPWLSLTSPSSGFGNTTVTYSVQINTATAPRTGILTIAGQAYTVTQAGFGCPITFNPLSASFSPAGGSGSVAVTLAEPDCQWTASSTAPWINIISGGGGTGNGTINYTVAASGSNAATRAGGIAVTASTSPASATFDIVQSGAGLEFFPVTPCRVFDTRSGAGFSGAFGPPALSAGQPRTFPIPSSSCGIPSTAEAYSFNVTAVPAGTLGYLTIWPAGLPIPNASTLNSNSDNAVANAAIVPAGASGAISVYSTDRTDLIADINGYFAMPSTGGLAFNPIVPCRVADTRSGAGFSSPFGPPALSAAQTRTFPIPQSSCGLPSNAGAYSLNFTAVPQGNLGYLTTWPTGQPLPNTSTLNSTGLVVANAAIVSAGSNGAINAFASDKTDLLFDANGYFLSPAAGGLNFYPVPPCRITDTRSGAGFTGSFGPPFLIAGQTRTFPVPSSACGIPSTAGAYSLNITAIPHGPLGFLTAWPTGQNRPNTSTLNSNGAVVPNAAIVAAGAGGAINIYVTDPIDLVIDINGYFAP